MRKTRKSTLSDLGSRPEGARPRGTVSVRDERVTHGDESTLTLTERDG